MTTRTMRLLAFALLALVATLASAAVTTFPNPTHADRRTEFGEFGVTVFPDSAKAITSSNTNTFERSVMVYVGGTACNATVTPANGGSNVAFAGLPAGSFVPVRVTAVLATGTTCTGMVAVY